MKTPVADRFWSKVDKNGPISKYRPALGQCWVWTGSTSRGYGHVKIEGRGVAVHRWAYQQLVAPIPKGLTLDHLCRTRHCVNVAHLDPVTNKVNALRGEGVGARHARRSRCSRGHLFDSVNTRYPSRGGRICLVCHRERDVVAHRRFRSKIRTHAMTGAAPEPETSNNGPAMVAPGTPRPGAQGQQA